MSERESRFFIGGPKHGHAMNICGESARVKCSPPSCLASFAYAEPELASRAFYEVYRVHRLGGRKGLSVMVHDRIYSTFAKYEATQQDRLRCALSFDCFLTKQPIVKVLNERMFYRACDPQVGEHWVSHSSRFGYHLVVDDYLQVSIGVGGGMGYYPVWKIHDSLMASVELIGLLANFGCWFRGDVDVPAGRTVEWFAGGVI